MKFTDRSKFPRLTTKSLLCEPVNLSDLKDLTYEDIMQFADAYQSTELVSELINKMYEEMDRLALAVVPKFKPHPMRCWDEQLLLRWRYELNDSYVMKVKVY